MSLNRVKSRPGRLKQHLIALLREAVPIAIVQGVVAAWANRLVPRAKARVEGEIERIIASGGD